MTIKCLNIGLYQSVTFIFEYLFVSNFGTPKKQIQQNSWECCCIR